MAWAFATCITLAGIVDVLGADALTEKNPQDSSLPLEGNQFAHNIFCCDAVPSWVKRSAENVFDPPFVMMLRKMPCKCPSPEMAATIAREEAGENNDPVPLPRVPAAELSPQDFFWRFARRGLPLILTGSVDDAWWARQITAKAIRCMEDEWDAGVAEYYACHNKSKAGEKIARKPRPLDEVYVAGEVRARACLLSISFDLSRQVGEPDECGDGDEWRPEKSYLVHRDECRDYANILLHHPPRFLRDIPAELRCQECSDYHIEGERLVPQILMSVEGYQFGFGGHFDAGCSGTVSYQLQGSKFWRVWSPWETLADATGAPG
jgi:hypothetical protein